MVVFNRQAIDFYNDINSNIYRVRTVEINTAVVSENLLIGCEQSSGSQKIGIAKITNKYVSSSIIKLYVALDMRNKLISKF